MLERAKEYTHEKDKYFHLEYARFADDLVVLIDGHRNWVKLPGQVMKRLAQEFKKLEVEINIEKTRVVDLRDKETFSFLGFCFHRGKTISGKYAPRFSPSINSRKKVVTKISSALRQMRSWPIRIVIETINPIILGWVNYFRIGQSSRCFGQIKDWLEKKMRRHLSRACKRQGVGWARWSKELLYEKLGLFNDYQINYIIPKVSPAHQAS
jgi:RNA-directed DNA polymerase